MDLNDIDYSRLRLKTKLIKAIQRIQTDISNGPAIEEYIVEQLDDLENENERSGDIGGRNTEDDQDTDDDCSGATDENPYHGIRLEKVININRVLTRTEQGKQIMECLKEGIRPNEKLMNQIKHVLCEYLRSTYGSRPSAFQKNLIALSLVETYPILRSSNNDVPQALWFHQHARGLHRHSGRLHYHLEYLIRKSADRKIIRTPTAAVPIKADPDLCGSVNSDDPVEDMEELIGEMKFICPTPKTQSRAQELWVKTFKDRDRVRQAGEFNKYLLEFPVSTCFDGQLLKLDFQKLYPDPPEFWVKFENLQTKVLRTYPSMLKHVQNDIIRTLGIIRLKNPSRGIKRTRQGNESQDNPLSGIVEWLQHDTSFPSNESDNPVLYLKGNFPEDSCDGTISWKSVNIPVKRNFAYSFELLCQFIAVLKKTGKPTDKQFFVFIMANLLEINTLSTTGEKFLSTLN
ncbi:uncharacterized protein LOC134215430 isoform X2 [Armigeres subalbatus]